MRRREFVKSLFSGAAVSAPVFGTLRNAQGTDEALAVRCERLLLQVREANQRLAEAEQELSQAYYHVHLINNQLSAIRLAEHFVRNDAEYEPSDWIHRDLDNSWERVCGLIREVFDSAKVGRKREPAT